MSKKRINKRTTPPPAEHALSDECDVWDMTNRYGTYNTQNTNGIQNDFPQIGQNDEASYNENDKTSKTNFGKKKTK